MSDLRTISSNPHVRSRVTTSNIMFWVVVALLPAALLGVINFGLDAAIVLAISVATTVLTELIYEKLMKKPVTIGDYSAVVTGLLLGMNLPSSVPWFIPVLGGVFAILAVKMVFGGLGQNFMNPALGGRCFLLISFTGYMTTFPAPNEVTFLDRIFNISMDAYTGATPLAQIKAGETVNVWNMIIGRTAGTIGETSMLAIVIGACILLLLGIIDLRIPGMYILTFVLFIGLFGENHFDPYYIAGQLSGGGLMLGAFFMATDYVSSPITSKGKYIFGAFLGILTGIFRTFSSSAESVSYAIIIANCVSPLIERWTLPRAFGIKKEKKETEVSKA